MMDIFCQGDGELFFLENNIGLPRIRYTTFSHNPSKSKYFCKIQAIFINIILAGAPFYFEEKKNKMIFTTKFMLFI
jgi:hypothetical protein